MRTSELNAETHNKNETNRKLLAEYSNQVLNTYRDNKLFEALLMDDFTTYFAKARSVMLKTYLRVQRLKEF